jgi:hypothetical protein
VICFDYWTDRLTCQVRFWDSSKPGRDGQGEFPSAPLTPRNLETVYQDINIASYLPGTTPACRIWGGISAGGMKTGATHDHAIPQSMGSFLYPPLGVSDRHWGYGAWSEIDKFFGFPPGEMRVVQKETMEGAACWLVRHVSLQPAGEDLAKHGKFQIGMVTRAWIDPRRGCLPVRMDWYSEVYRDGALFRERKPEPYSVLKVNAIKKIDRGGFYPTEGVTESHVPDPSQPFEPLTGAEFVAGKTLDLQYVMDQSTRWFVKSIEPDAKLPRESLAFEFPDGTNYFDSLRGRTLVKGISEEEYDRLIAGGDDVGGEPPSGSPYRLYLIIAGNIILFAALIAVWRKRRRSCDRRDESCCWRRCCWSGRWKARRVPSRPGIAAWDASMGSCASTVMRWPWPTSRRGSTHWPPARRWSD